jgi:hypothetical protein
MWISRKEYQGLQSQLRDQARQIRSQEREIYGLLDLTQQRDISWGRRLWQLIARTS